MILSVDGKVPIIAETAFIAPTAVIVGDVIIEDGASVWYGTVIRADTAPIRIGRNTNIQDNCTIHVDHDAPCSIGPHVTVGHNAVVHGCTLEDHVLVGMNAVVLSKAEVKRASVVAAGSVVMEGQAVGPNELVAGAPAKVKKILPENMAEILDLPVEEYLRLSAIHRKTEKL